MIRFPPKKILVPFDFSDVSIGAWKHAAALVRWFGASIDVVHVEEWAPSAEWSPPTLLTPEREEEVLRGIRSTVGAGPKVLILEGDPTTNILRLARTRRPDIIVMGTHGRTGLERAWMGSVAEAVIRLSPVPVLAARGEAGHIRSILAPVNFTGYSEYGLAYAAGVAAAMKAKLTVLHVSPDESQADDNRIRLSRLLDRLPHAVRDACMPQVETVAGEATRGIQEAGKRHDLIVLVAHEKSMVKDMTLGTTAERVLRHAAVPVLAVPAPKHPFSLDQWAPGTESITLR